jgi:hypothetical protein
MPGHIKLTKGQVDPDPTEFLVPNIEMKRQELPPLIFMTSAPEKKLIKNNSEPEVGK